MSADSQQPSASSAGQDMPFDRALRRLRRDRAARRTTDRPVLDRMTDDLLDRLALVTRPFTHALDLGTGPGTLTGALRAMGLTVETADAGALFAGAGARCDEDHLPFPAGRFDLIVSAGVLDGVNDLPGALIQARRLLKPDGLFLAAFLGAGSLPKLRTALQAAEAAEGVAPSPRLHPQIDLRAAGDLMARAGFALPVVDADPLDVRYRDLGQLVGDLRAAGWTNILRARARRPFGRQGYAAAIATFAGLTDADGRTTERFEIIHLSGWAPSADQPQPARRGSGTVSLAEALRPKRP